MHRRLDSYDACHLRLPFMPALRPMIRIAAHSTFSSQTSRSPSRKKQDTQVETRRADSDDVDVKRKTADLDERAAKKVKV